MAGIEVRIDGIGGDAEHETHLPPQSGKNFVYRLAPRSWFWQVTVRRVPALALLVLHGNGLADDDASYFNREYKRMFDEPPMRDVARLRDVAMLDAGV